MIYNDDFVWLHFPKCAGAKVEKIFSEYFSSEEGLHLDPIKLDSYPAVDWHDSIDDREANNPLFNLGGRDVIVSIRRLPSWLVSRFCYEVKRSPNLPHDAYKLLEARFLEANGYENNADYYMNKYVPKNILARGNVRFLRTEFFAEDFKSIFSNYLDLKSVPDEVYHSHVNSSENNLPEDLLKKLNAFDFSELAPYWCEVENIAYGNKVLS